MPDAMINEDLGYPIVVGDNLRASLSEFVRKEQRPKVLLCDANKRVQAIADEIARLAGNPPVLPFTLGEKRKRLATVESVLDAMVRAGVERGDLVMGVGGGVASDLFGFAAAIYMR
ncbi:MAG TPA: hypothetical protein VMF61_00690, partial [Candidatus Acidoferrales bacterium]|nr:hypothetical protein [Candidatus Acidoferrales bacterium]